MLSSATEHKAVLEPLEHLSSQGFAVELMHPDQQGRFNVEDVLAQVRPETALVSIMHVNNETGVIQPVAELARALAETQTLLHVDAAQSFAKVDTEALRSPIDLISLSGHKIGAPMGIGALVARRRGWARVPLQPLMFGGGQERKLRPGTAPVPLIAGLNEAICERKSLHQTWLADTLQFREDLLHLVAEFDGTINGSETDSAPHILNVSFPGIDSEALVVALRDVAAIATGSACTSSSYTPSHVLVAMGLAPEIVAGSIRISWWGRPTDDLSPLRGALASLLARV
jgi:cysteine desulfurase